MEQQTSIDPNLSREEKYPLIIQQAKALVEGETDLIANMANISALIYHNLGFHWVGFYRKIGDELVLGPFQGPVACTRIKIPNGVCGTAVQKKETIVVSNMADFPGHIACSPFSKSELVIPYVENGEVKWVLDIDSTELNDFSSADVEAFDSIVKLSHSI